MTPKDNESKIVFEAKTGNSISFVYKNQEDLKHAVKTGFSKFFNKETQMKLDKFLSQ